MLNNGEVLGDTSATGGANVENNKLREKNNQRPKLSLAELGADTNLPEKTEWTANLVRSALEELSALNPDPIGEEETLNKISKESGFSKKTVKVAYEKTKNEWLSHCNEEKSKPAMSFSLNQMQKAEELKNCKNLFDIFRQKLDEVDHLTSRVRADAMLATIGMTLSEQVHYICYYGFSSNGKTEAAETVCQMIDFDEQLDKVLRYIDTSPEWLKYAGREDGSGLKHKLIFLDELNPVRRGEDDRRQMLLRQCNSENSTAIKFSVVVKTSNGNAAQDFIIQKPFIFLWTSINAPQRWDEQIRNRGVWLEFSLAPCEVETIINRIKKPIYSKEEKINTFRGFNCFLSSLKRLGPEPDDISQVKIPFLSEISLPGLDGIGSDIRRFKLFKQFIMASALLHQHHRQIEDSDGKNILIAEEVDFLNIKSAFEVMVPPVSLPSGEAHLTTFKKIAAWLFENTGSTRRQIQKGAKISKKAAEEHLNDLVEIDLLEVDRSDKTFTYSLSPKARASLEDKMCPNPDTPLPTAEMTEAINQIIEDHSSKIKINSKEPQASMSLKSDSRDINGSPDDRLNEEPHSLTLEQAGKMIIDFKNRCRSLNSDEA